MLTGITLFRLVTAALLPVLVTVGFYQAEKKSRFGKVSNDWKQLIIGVSFGVVAILATEFGIPVDGAVLNVRNAAPLTAGLIFGWPSGLIAGLVGGVERWFSHAGDYTRLACTIGTIVAGIFGAAVRKFMIRIYWLLGNAGTCVPHPEIMQRKGSLFCHIDAVSKFLLNTGKMAHQPLQRTPMAQPLLPQLIR